MNKNTLINNFSKNAGTYETYASVQKNCAEELLKLIPDSDLKTILEIGCGPGIFTEMLFDRFKRSTITAIDISQQMIQLAQDRMRGKYVKFINKSIESLDIEKKFELVTSNVTLHWVKDLDSAIHNILQHITSKGLIAISLYGPDTFKELKKVLSMLYGKKHWLSSSSFRKKDEIYRRLKHSFTCIEMIEKNFELEHSDIWDFFYSIKKTGTQGEGISAHVSLTRTRIQEIENAYLDKYGCIKATHNVFFLKGIKK